MSPATSPALERLLRRRLLIVSGKGGTGKSSLVAALSRSAARAGVRAVAVETGPEAVLPPLLSSSPPASAFEASRTPVELDRDLYHLRIDPLETLTEYLELQLGLRRAVRAVMANAGFQRLLDVAPGWRDLITLGKLWYLSRLEDRGAARWPLLILDAPATGHGLSLLTTPDAVRGTLRSGPLRKHVDGVRELLRDTDRTRFLSVALPEELPVSEALELAERVAELGIRAEAPVCNRSAQDAPLDADRLLRALARLDGTGAPQGWLAPDALAAELSDWSRRSERERGQIERLSRGFGRPALVLPDLPQPLDGPGGTLALAGAFETALAQAEPAR